MWEAAISARRDRAAAVVDGTRTWSYADLAERVAAHRCVFERDGVRPGQTVALLADKSAHAVAATLALAETGATVFIPPRGLGPELQADLLSRAAADYTVQAAGHSGGETGGRNADEDPESLRATVVRQSHRASDRRAALVLSTSGSTGVPKLVPLPSPALERFAGWAADAFGIGPGVRVLSYAPLNFDLSLLDVWGTLIHGGTTVLVRPEDAARADRVARVLVDQHPEVVQAVPLLVRLLATADVPPQPQVRHLVLTGESFPVEHWSWLRRAFPRAEVWNLYGCTETNDSFRHRVVQADIDTGRVPIGRPLPGVEARIQDRGTRSTSSEGYAEGELLVSTPFQTPGYLRQGDPEEDPQSSPFLRLPDSDRVFYRTGDIVRRTPDGVYHLVDRISRIVKVNGVRTSLAEVERVLAEHPDVAEAVVFTVPDPVAGQVLHAAVLPRSAERSEQVGGSERSGRTGGSDRTAGPGSSGPDNADSADSPGSGSPDRPGATLDTLALRGHCRRRLAAAAVPSRYHLLALDLPRTSTGKPDRAKIRALLTEGAAP